MLADLIQVSKHPRATTQGAVGITNGAHIHAHQLELGAHVRALEERVTAGQGRHRHLGHLVARRHQAETAVVPGRAFADGENVRVTGEALVVHLDTAALAHLQPALPAQLIPGPDAGGEHDQVGLVHLVVLKHHPVARILTILNALSGTPGQHLHAQGLDFLPQQLAAFVVYLHRHQARCKLHHGGIQVQPTQGIRRFQPQQTTAYHHAGAGVFGGFANGVQIFQGAIDQTVRPVVTGNGGNKGKGAGGQHDLVIRETLTVGQRHSPRFPINRRGLHAQAQVIAPGRILLRRAHRQLGGTTPLKIFGQVNPVVGDLFLLTDHRHGEVLCQTGFRQVFKKVMADHAIADHDQFCLAHCGSSTSSS